MRLLIRESRVRVRAQEWTMLPTHLLQHIFAHCAHSSFTVLGRVCQAWHVEMHRESWRRFCKLERIATDWINANKSLQLSFSNGVSSWLKAHKPIRFMPRTIRLLSRRPQPKLRLARPHFVLLFGPQDNNIVKFALATLPVTHQATIPCPTGTLEMWF
jgi:hypothetical protein